MPKGRLKKTGSSATKLWRGRLHLNPSSFHVIAEAPYSTGEWNAFSSRKDVLYPHEMLYKYYNSYPRRKAVV
jgi:hypothetical protein